MANTEQLNEKFRKKVEAPAPAELLKRERPMLQQQQNLPDEITQKHQAFAHGGGL